MIHNRNIPWVSFEHTSSVIADLGYPAYTFNTVNQGQITPSPIVSSPSKIASRVLSATSATKTGVKILSPRSSTINFKGICISIARKVYSRSLAVPVNHQSLEAILPRAQREVDANQKRLSALTSPKPPFTAMFIASMFFIISKIYPAAFPLIQPWLLLSRSILYKVMNSLVL